MTHIPTAGGGTHPRLRPLLRTWASFVIEVLFTLALFGVAWAWGAVR